MSLCSAKPWITTAVTDLSMQKYVSLPLAYCSENLRITSRFFAEAACANVNVREGGYTRVSHDGAAVAARAERARNENETKTTFSWSRRSSNRTCDVSERVTSRRALGRAAGLAVGTATRRGDAIRAIGRGRDPYHPR